MTKLLQMATLCACACFSAFSYGATILQSAGSDSVSFEAETPSPIINGSPAFWVVTNDAAASGGKVLYINGTTDNALAPHSFVQYQIKFATPGTYNLYYRWKADAARTVADQFTANSTLIPNTFGAFSTAGSAGAANYHTGISNGTQAPANNVFDWSREPDGTTTYTVSAADVAAGVPLVLSIGTREAGFVVDRWVLTTATEVLSDATLDAVQNSETSVVNQGASENHVAFEAETKGTIINGTPAFWTVTNDAPASAGAVLYIGGTTDNALAPHSFVQYQIKFTQPGTYHLYYRYKADPARTVADQFTANSTLIPNTFGNFRTSGPSGLADFHTSASNGSQAPANNVYDWQREADGSTTFVVSAEDVAAGVPLIFSVGTREAGFMLDRWVFSPEGALTDAALDALPNSGAAAVLPELVRATGSAALNQVTVIFNRPLNPGTVAAGDFSVNGLSVNTATVDADDARRVYLTTTAQTQGTTYTVTVNGVSDTSGNAIAANSTINFTGWKLVEGWATTEIYQSITGSTVEDLKSSPAFLARTPDEVRWVKGFQLNNDPRAPNMGARITAFFQPPGNGAYNFYVNNDNEAELLLSTDQTEANLQSLGLFPLSPPAFDDVTFAASPSLNSGQRYLLEGLVKSDGGDVYMNVAAQPATSPTPGSTLPVLGWNRMSTFVNPDLGIVTFTQQPANAVSTVGSRATFTVKASASEAPLYYQWKVNGADIPGATRPSFTTPVLAGTDSGKVYSVVVSVAGKDTASANATLIVNAGEPSNLQPYIGINFVGGGDNLPGRLTAVDVAGVVQQENWNNLAGSQFEAVSLTDAAGSATPVTLSAAATEHWYSGTLGAGSADGVMLQGFLSTGASLEP
ncbi:MAG: Ig-like domain-containing protein, partial [Limisphaerales bacterium]